MLKEAVLHIPDSSYAFAMDENSVFLRLRVKKGENIRCYASYGDRVSIVDPPKVKSVSMKKASYDDLFDYYECVIKTKLTRIFYYFRIEEGKDTYFYYSDSFHKEELSPRTEYYQFAYIRREDIPNIPEWAKNAVMYQIFPDSFATSHRFIRGNSKELSELTPAMSNGGTLKGIIENVDYIKNLGVNCLYINPIFAASSYHKYDINDYFKIDPDFGTEEDLKELVTVCHKNGIRVLLDGVFNHCGPKFFAFEDVLKNGEKSKYKDWFYHLEFPIKTDGFPNYAAFAYVADMPKLNTGNPETADYFCKVGKYWIEKADIDGWRLDVANEINHDFWRKFRESVRSVKPDAFLIGEIWEDSQQWLRGDQLDSTMNYSFTDLSKDYFAKTSISTSEFDTKVHAMLLRYKKPMVYVQMNLLDSHDVPRFLSVCGGDIKKLKLAFLFMMTFVGIPSVLYGDEAAISGLSEREYRRPIPWSDSPEKGELYKFLSSLITLRKENPALIRGEFKTALCDNNGTFAFKREFEGEKFLIILNNSEKAKKITLSSEFSAHFKPVFYEKGSFTFNDDVLSLAPLSGVIASI